MTLEQDNIYEYTASVAPGYEHEYKFGNGTTWDNAETVTGACATGPPFNNRILTVPEENTVLDVVCFGSCIPCVVPTVTITFLVDLSYVDVSLDGVHIVGSFNEWDPTADELTAVGNGLFDIPLDLSKGVFIEYRYYNGYTAGNSDIVNRNAHKITPGFRKFFWKILPIMLYVSDNV